MHITESPIRVSEFLGVLPPASCGAVASFVGVVRNHDHGRAVWKLYYESYRPMAEKRIGSIIEEAKGRWPVEEIKVLHRVGRLGIGEAAIAVRVSSAHRAEAFAACEHVVEQIKHTVPIWKNEFFEDGTSEWVLCSGTLGDHEGISRPCGLEMTPKSQK
ncbi:MAG: molybdenum cofactor biosynthesis protein MoaE [Candidatus Omnitrophota bacterium]